LGEDLLDCQDSLSANIETNRFAVADGVSRSFYPAIFSKQLTEFFCSGKDYVNCDLFHQKNWEEWLDVSQKKWLEYVQEKVNNTKKYYIKNRFYNNEHAGATFAGIEFYQKDQSLFWNAMIIGDSCIIHIDKNNNQTNKYLIESSDNFNFTPSYFPSRFIKENPYQPVFINDKAASVNDVFIIATDAISKWILLLMENKKSDVLFQIDQLSDEVIDYYRHDEEFLLENDDIALLVLKIIQESTEERDLKVEKG